MYDIKGLKTTLVVNAPASTIATIIGPKGMSDFNSYACSTNTYIARCYAEANP
jgi:hypothetical protein